MSRHEWKWVPHDPVDESQQIFKYEYFKQK